MRLPIQSACMVMAVAVAAACRPSPEPTSANLTPLVDTKDTAAAAASPPASSVAPAPPSSSGEPHADPWRVPELGVAIAPPDGAICTLERAATDFAVVARPRPGGAKAFTVRGVNMAITLAAGEGLGSATFDGERDGIALRGAINRTDMRLFARRPFLMGGFLIPRAWTELTVRKIAAEGVTVGVDGSKLDGVQLLTQPLAGEIACDALRVDHGDEFGEFAGLPKWLAKRSGWGELIGTTPVPLTAKPGRSPVAMVPVHGSQPIGVAVFGKYRGLTRVAIPRDDALLIGWVPTSRIKARKEEVLDLFGMGGLGLSGGSRSTPIVCPHRLPIAVSIEGRRSLMAVAEPGVGVLSWGDALDGLKQVQFYQRYWFQLADGATLVVMAADLAGCRRAKP